MASEPRMPPIDWELLSNAVRYYKAAGFEYIEVPWLVSHQAMSITCPKMQYVADIGDGKAFVGSAEQSFLQLMLDGVLRPDRRYVACTPCVRLDEDQDGWHFPGFMKVELFIPQMERHRELIEIAQSCMLDLTGRAPNAVETPEGFDLQLNGIVVGSYGTRRCAVMDMLSFSVLSEPRSGPAATSAAYKTLGWSYGTGLALPRFSMASALRK